MADNLAVTAGSGSLLATDQVTHSGDATAHVELIRSVHVIGAEGSKTLVANAARSPLRISVASSGLTTATTAYTAGDQVGTQFTLASAALESGGLGIITGVELISAADIIGAYDVFIFRSSVTLASDNAAFAISDSDALNLVGLVQLSGAYDIGNNRICQAYNLAVPYDCSGTSLFAALITRAGHTFFGAATDLQLVVHVERMS